MELNFILFFYFAQYFPTDGSILFRVLHITSVNDVLCRRVYSCKSVTEVSDNNHIRFSSTITFPVPNLDIN